MKLFLDDLRNAPKGWVLCRSINEMLLMFEQERHIDAISLDHDLGCNDSGYFICHSETGYDFCKWLIEQPEEVWPELIILHTANPVGRDNMRQLLKRYAPKKTMIQ